MAPNSILFLFITSLALFAPLASAASIRRSPIKALVAPITKDDSTSLYTVALNATQPLVLDLAGPLLWSPCPRPHRSLPRNSSACAAAGVFRPPQCPRIKFVRGDTCTVSLANPVTGACAFSDLTLITVAISATNGQNPTSSVSFPEVVSSCAPKSLLASLPASAVGVAGFARSVLSLPSQLTSRLSLKKQFAICLPSSGGPGAPGVAFFGSPPFIFLAAPPLDIAPLLSYTPLLRHPTSPAYFLSAKAVAVNQVAVPFLARTLEIDSLGRGGVAISTAARYTTLRSHIYRPLLAAFAAATRGVPRRPRVEPFGLCLDSRKLGATRVGYGVPLIDVMLQGGKNWTFFGANSMKQVDAVTACFAFVDGGPRAEQAVVIGGYQLENSFLLFDTERSRLGFLSTLLGIRTTCSNFNFTINGA